MTLGRFPPSSNSPRPIAWLAALVAAAALALAFLPAPALADPPPPPPNGWSPPGPYHLSGTVTGSDGEPLAGIEIWAKNMSPNQGGNWPATTGADGGYSLSVTSGEYLLGVWADTYLIHFGCISVIGGSVVTGCPAAAIAVNGADVSGVDFSLPVTEASLPTGTAHISGVVRGPDGTGLAGITVDVGPTGDYADFGNFPVTTGSGGSFSVEVAAPLSFEIMPNWDGSEPSGSVGLNPNYFWGCYASGAPGNFAASAAEVPPCTAVPVTLGVDIGGIDVTLVATPSPTPTPTPAPTPAPTLTLAPSVPIVAVTTTCAQAGQGGSVSWSGGLEGWVFSVFGPAPARDWAGSWDSDTSGGGTASPLALGTYQYAYGPPGTTATGEGTLTISVCGATPSGTNVVVSPVVSGGSVSGIRVTFADVSAPGETSVALSNAGPPVSGTFVSLASSPTYYDVSTTATHSGPITLCLPYDPTAYPDPSLVRLLHWNGASWDDVTRSLDATKPTVCGAVTSLSPFVVAQRRSTPNASPAGNSSALGPIIAVIVVIVIVAAAFGLFLLRRRKRHEVGAK